MAAGSGEGSVHFGRGNSGLSWGSSSSPGDPGDPWGPWGLAAACCAAQGVRVALPPRDIFPIFANPAHKRAGRGIVSTRAGLTCGLVPAGPQRQEPIYLLAGLDSREDAITYEQALELTRETAPDVHRVLLENEPKREAHSPRKNGQGEKGAPTIPFPTRGKAKSNTAHILAVRLAQEKPAYFDAYARGKYKRWPSNEKGRSPRAPLGLPRVGLTASPSPAPLVVS
jgi:hypothetical protein